MTESSLLLLQRFKEKKAEKDSVTVQQARRLVNLYRSLSCFGDDFIPKYNQMLLGISANVKRLLSSFMGGKEVEDYLEFLEQNSDSIQEGNDQLDSNNVPQMKGYLPAPDADLGKITKEGTAIILEDELKKLKEQNRMLLQQKQSLLDALNKLAKHSETIEKTPSSSFESFSEIIEDTSGDKSNE